ncbi:hypothetical protein FRC12_014059 [Ceratobasidium sp. 428]|nr:hypothetical protein FRC12_014059 [Ceratobasidium sp. 428]
MFLENPLFKETLRSVLHCWFEHGTPEPASTSGSTLSQLNVSLERFEGFFQPIMRLRLEGSFPPWSSRAYHGLVHLQLDAGSIEEVELINLLSSSPRLRTLSFSIPVSGLKPRNAAIIPVSLSLLKTLNLDRMDINDVWSLLRLVSPGSGPLKLSIGIASFNTTENSFTRIEEAQAFLQRSNITKVRFTGGMDNRDIWFPRAFSEFPRLHTLTLSEYSFCNYEKHAPFNPYSAAICSSLRELYLVRCRLDTNLLERLLRIHSIQALRIAGCTVLENRWRC